MRDAAISVFLEGRRKTARACEKLDAMNLVDVVHRQRQERLEVTRVDYDMLCSELEQVVIDAVYAFARMDRLHHMNHVIIPDVVDRLQRVSKGMQRRDIYRFCYIKPRDIDFFRSAGITQSIIMHVQDKIAKRNATLHDVSDRTKSTKVFLQLVLAPKHPPVPRRGIKRTIRSCHARSRSASPPP